MFSYFSRIIGFNMSCKSSPPETKLQEVLKPIFFWKNKKASINLSSAEFAQTVLMLYNQISACKYPISLTLSTLGKMQYATY